MRIELAMRLAAAAILVTGCATGTSDPDLTASTDAQRDTPANHWPEIRATRTVDAAMERRIDTLMATMTLEEKVGQLIQADINWITPQDLLEYPIGSILNGGNSAPEQNVRIEAKAWLELADEFYAAVRQRPGAAIPLIWGTDAVHGHNNVVGATVFPHNIGLGAAGDPELLRRIGEVTALETVITGQDWSFAPTLAVARNDRWGRTYESFSEDPTLVARYAGDIVEGLQGAVSDPNRLRDGRVLSSAKHFVGDGGTEQGVDQGNSIATEAELAAVHAAGYVEAIESGVEIIMASFNSWHGKKLHGHRYLLTDVLKDHWGFDGFIVGDWNGHGQVQGCSAVHCPAAIMAGLDMFMAPDSWRALYHNTLNDVREGTLSTARLNDAVRRILRVKLRAGLFDKPKPSERAHAGDFASLGGPAHRAVAREAVRKSLVLLKNNNQTLPIAGTASVLVTGPAAHAMTHQTGGWTLSWQGTGNTRDDFPNGETLWEGLQSTIEAAGGSAILSNDGTYSERPDVAVVIFGEPPYAEFEGDREDVAFRDDGEHARLIERFVADGIPVVSVFLSGRPLWINRSLNQSDAFVAAWLPGSEGGGLADVLIGGADGEPRHDFTGRLSFSWPDHPHHDVLHAGTDGAPLFEVGYGLSYADNGNLNATNEWPDFDLFAQKSTRELVARGRPLTPWRMQLAFGSTQHDPTGTLRYSGDAIELGRADYHAQEDSMSLQWHDQASVTIHGPAVDWSRAANGDLALVVDAWVDRDQLGDLSVSVGCEGGCQTAVALRDLVATDSTPGWHQLAIPLKCFSDNTDAFAMTHQGLVLSASEPAQLVVYSATLAPNEGKSACH